MLRRVEIRCLRHIRTTDQLAVQSVHPCVRRARHAGLCTAAVQQPSAAMDADIAVATKSRSTCHHECHQPTQSKPLTIAKQLRRHGLRIHQCNVALLASAPHVAGPPGLTSLRAKLQAPLHGSVAASGVVRTCALRRYKPEFFQPSETRAHRFVGFAHGRT
jgi:hypothetical protein